MRGEDEKEEAWVEALSFPLTGNGGSQGQGLGLLHETVPLCRCLVAKTGSWLKKAIWVKNKQKNYPHVLGVLLIRQRPADLNISVIYTLA